MTPLKSRLGLQSVNIFIIYSVNSSGLLHRIKFQKSPNLQILTKTFSDLLIVSTQKDPSASYIINTTKDSLHKLTTIVFVNYF